MYEVFVERSFSAAHYLRDYPGDCEHLHGHNWQVRVHVEADTLNEIQVALDFRDLKRVVDSILGQLDHTNINDHPEFQDRNPSSENIASFIFRETAKGLKDFKGVRVRKVTVMETPNQGVTYWE